MCIRDRLNTLWNSCQLLNFSINHSNLVLFFISNRSQYSWWCRHYYSFFCNNHLCYFWPFWWTAGKKNWDGVSPWRNFRSLQWCLQRIHYPLSFFSNTPNRTWLDFLFSHLGKPCCIYRDLFGAEYQKGIVFWENRITGRSSSDSIYSGQFNDISGKIFLVEKQIFWYPAPCLVGNRFNFGSDFYSCRKHKTFATHT